MKGLLQTEAQREQDTRGFARAHKLHHPFYTHVRSLTTAQRQLLASEVSVMMELVVTRKVSVAFSLP